MRIVTILLMVIALTGCQISAQAISKPKRYKVAYKHVNVSCFPDALRLRINRVARHYKKTVLVHSGYRSKRHNRLVGGARLSQHVLCKAADISVPGVSNRNLAKYLRAQKKRGGVGTYGCSPFVHMDLGKKRDWNWRCKRGKRR